VNEDRVRVAIDAHGVADVALARPDKMNALDRAMFDAIAATLQRLAGEPGLRAVVLHGEGRAFCAGLDMASFAKMGEGASLDVSSDLVARTHGIANLFQHVAWGWRELPVPVIAAVCGVAFGGGLQIALGADIRLVTADLKMSVMEVKWGLVPDMAGCVLMNQLASTDVVRELTFTGRTISGTEAVAFGLATRVCADPLADARTLARHIAQQNPDTMRANKRLLNLALTATEPDVLHAESVEQHRLIGSANQLESVRAGIEKRPARFVDPAPPR
jgi:enoyl-CoA hydratase/carnithine racemase